MGHHVDLFAERPKGMPTPIGRCPACGWSYSHAVRVKLAGETEGKVMVRHRYRIHDDGALECDCGHVREWDPARRRWTD